MARQRAARAMRLGFVLAIIVPMAGLGSCTAPVTVVERGRAVEHHFGNVRVIRPPSEGAFYALGTETFGIRIENGLAIGYLESSRIVVPLDCRLVAIVRTREQFGHLVDTFKGLGRDQLCVTVSPSS